MGGAASRDRLLQAPLPEGERYFGLENFGNTCYANSVLQGLYSCRPFRERLIQYAAAAGGAKAAEDNILTCLAELFLQISSQKKRTGVVSPKRFIQRLKRDREQFRSYDEHQDAHELLLDLINSVSDLLEAEQKAKLNGTGGGGGKPAAAAAAAAAQGRDSGGAAAAEGGGGKPPIRTWVHDLFQGREVHETQCLGCETVTRNEVVFYHLSLAIAQHSSLTHCLRQFSGVDTLKGEEKFFCNACGTYQEAQKRTRLSALPDVLLLHLNRFKYTTHMDRDGYVRVVRSKLMYRVVFPFELKLGSTSAEDGPDGADAAYQLFAVIVHVGSGLDHGHYVALVKSADVWLLYEDDSVEPVPESTVQQTFGAASDFMADIAAEEARGGAAMRLVLDAKKKNEAAMEAMRETCELLKAMDSGNEDVSAEIAQMDGQLIALEGLGSRIGKDIVELFKRSNMLQQLRDTLPPTADAQSPGQPMPQLEDYLEWPPSKDIAKLERQRSGDGFAKGGARIIAEGLAALIGILAFCVGSVMMASWVIQAISHMLPFLWHTLRGK